MSYCLAKSENTLSIRICRGSYLRLLLNLAELEYQKLCEEDVSALLLTNANLYAHMEEKFNTLITLYVKIAQYTRKGQNSASTHWK